MIWIVVRIDRSPLWALLPYPVEYEAYKLGKVVFYLQLLLFSGLAFFLLLPLMKRTLTISLDTDWLWRVLAFRAASRTYAFAASLGATLQTQIGGGLAALRSRAETHFGSRMPKDGVFARSWSIGTTALWIAVLLTAYVLVYVI